MNTASKRTASKAATSVTQSRRGLLVGVLYTDPEKGTTGEGWQHPGHGDAPAHRLRLATAPERRRYRRAVSRMEGEA